MLAKKKLTRIRRYIKEGSCHELWPLRMELREENHVNHFQGKLLCEDCCFELMNPPKVCDPLAVSSTLSVRKQLGQTGTEGLLSCKKRFTTQLQKEENQQRRINKPLESDAWGDGTRICYPAPLWTCCERSKKETLCISQNFHLRTLSCLASFIRVAKILTESYKLARYNSE